MLTVSVPNGSLSEISLGPEGHNLRDCHFLEENVNSMEKHLLWKRLGTISWAEKSKSLENEHSKSSDADKESAGNRSEQQSVAYGVARLAKMELDDGSPQPPVGLKKEDQELPLRRKTNVRDKRQMSTRTLSESSCQAVGLGSLLLSCVVRFLFEGLVLR